MSADGYLRYFENENKLVAEDTIFLPEKAVAITVGPNASYHAKHDAPEGYSNQFLIEVVLHDNDYWLLCADSIDDML